ncbi:MAG: hypothetical protein OS130_09205 [Thermodesulfobacteriota bacterium]|jgi:hypothetical protein|nr:MAG: hypothetical protein OS130_09205 [Thermodesulfobacteriota bacterium]
MKRDDNERIVYSINVSDIQQVANEVLDRDLTKKEIRLVENSIGDNIDWFQAIEDAILKNITQES